MTLPSNTLSAAKSVAVPFRLSSCVIVPHRPFFRGRPGWVRSKAWIWLFSSTHTTIPLDLPDRTDPFGLHALSPQRDSVSIDFVVGSDFQIGISFCSGQNQPAAQGHLLRGSLSRFPTNQLRLIFCG